MTEKDEAPARGDAFDEAPSSLKSRAGWFVLLWIAGVVVISIVGYGIRFFLIG